MVKDAIDDDLHATAMNLLHNFCKKCVGCFQVCLVCNTVHVAGCQLIFCDALWQKFTFVGNNFAKVWVDIVVILDVVFVVRWAYEKWIEIDDINA